MADEQVYEVLGNTSDNKFQQSPKVNNLYGMRQTSGSDLGYLVKWTFYLKKSDTLDETVYAQLIDGSGTVGSTYIEQSSTTFSDSDFSTDVYRACEFTFSGSNIISDDDSIIVYYNGNNLWMGRGSASSLGTWVTVYAEDGTIGYGTSSNSKTGSGYTGTPSSNITFPQIPQSKNIINSGFKS